MQNYLSQFAKKYGIYNDFSNNYISSPPFQPWLINSSQKLSLNSGTERDFSYFLKLNKIEKKKTYFYFQLPLEIGRICASITEAYFHHANDHQIWPGGRKSKLPTSTGVN